MARCETCGAPLENPADRFCGGDRCLRVLWPLGDRRQSARSIKKLPPQAM